MNELVERLTNGLHPIVAGRSASARELRKQIERGWVILKFTDTRGGTELGSRLDMERTRLDGADFESGSGHVHLVGNLTLNYEKVQLVADIDLASLKGTGHLVLIEEAGGSQQARTGDSKDQMTENEGAASAAVATDDAPEVSEVSEAKMKARPRKKKTNATTVAQAN